MALINPIHVFGLDRKVNNNIGHVNEETVIYPAGTHLIVYNFQTLVQRFIPIRDGLGITTMAINQQQQLIIVGVMTEKTPNILIYDLVTLKKKKLIPSSETSTAKEFVSICFTADGKHIVAQSGGVEWYLYMWNHEKGKLIASSKASNNNNSEVRQISCNPFDQNVVQTCVIGTALFRLFKFLDGQFRIVTQQKPDHDLLCHSWITESRIAVGTNTGKILIYEHGEMLIEILYVPSEIEPVFPSFNSLVHLSGGFLVGTSNGSIVLYEKTDDEQMYKKSRDFELENGSVATISINPNQDSAVCTLKNCQIYHISLDYDPNKVEDLKVGRDQSLFQEFHWDQIVGLDTCARKPILATCGTDKSVRIWNYAENVVEVSKFFKDDPCSVAIHPSGLYLLVGFNDSLNLLNILIDDIRPYWTTNVRGCRECRFSNGGQYFAAVFGSTIVVHSTWTFQQVFNLKGHTGKVKSIYWSSDDRRLLSCGLDGKICNWNMRTGKKEWEHEDSKFLYSSISCTPDSKLIYVVGSDGVIRELNNDGALLRDLPIKTCINNVLIARSGRYFFASGNQGVIRALKYPFVPESTASNAVVPTGAVINALEQSLEIQCHSSNITRLRLSYDESHMFSVSEDGCLWIYKVLEKQAEKKAEKDLKFSDEILVTRSDLKQTFKVMSELKKTVEELKKENENILIQKDQQFIEKLSEVSEKFNNEIDSLQQIVAELKTEIEVNEPKQLEAISDIKASHSSEVQKIVATFDRKMEAESVKYTELDEKNQTLQKQWESQMGDMEIFHKKRIQEINAFYDKKILEKGNEINKIKMQLAKQGEEYRINLLDIDEDVNQEIISLQYSYEQKMREERESLSAIREENLAMKARFESLNKQIEDRKQEIVKMIQEEKRLHGIIKSLNKDIQVMQERDDTIMDKEKRIYDLKKKNQELEKFKFVLDYKIVELKKQVEPRELDIIKLSELIKAMDEELNGYHHKYDEKESEIHTLSLKLKAAKLEVESEKLNKAQMKQICNKIESDVEQVYKLIETPNEMKKQLIAVYIKYENLSEQPSTLKSKPKLRINGNFNKSDNTVCKVTMSKKNPVLDESNYDTSREREHKERTIETLLHSLEGIKESRYNDNLRTMQENVLLLRYFYKVKKKKKNSEVNILKKALKSSEIRTSRLEKGIKKIEQGKFNFNLLLTESNNAVEFDKNDAFNKNFYQKKKTSNDFNFDLPNFFNILEIQEDIQKQHNGEFVDEYSKNDYIFESSESQLNSNCESYILCKEVVLNKPNLKLPSIS
ncbi:Cilia- and flagella-associated protein 57 [Lobulomyces angularis]|nr:Cilia- and flagella-associated protein 57 [Lobulomyces angularis]